eukprot:GHVU01181008.1.p2 GENE.GHVU01181008.1~~GHVU01181008.1.p2  ORF type:complete len:250 (+),score=57.98 GHVU01181008.1:223-972(+)
MHLSTYLPTHPSIHLSIRLPTYLPTNPSICPSIQLASIPPSSTGLQPSLQRVAISLLPALVSRAGSLELLSPTVVASVESVFAVVLLHSPLEVIRRGGGGVLGSFRLFSFNALNSSCVHVYECDGHTRTPTFYTCMCCADEFTEDHVINCQVFGLLYSWLLYVYADQILAASRKRQTRAPAPTHRHPKARRRPGGGGAHLGGMSSSAAWGGGSAADRDDDDEGEEEKEEEEEDEEQQDEEEQEGRRRGG